MSRSAFLRLEWGVSLALTAAAFIWGAIRDLPFLSAPVPRAADVTAGFAAAGLLWLCIPLLRLSGGVRRVWERVLVPFAQQLRVTDVIVIALLSGVSEELFFRGVLLAELGLVASSLLFGALHALSAVYALWAALTGAAFGWLALEHQSLAAPIIAHVTYNLGALLVLRHWPAPPRAPDPPGTAPSP